jgi:hypothetical protein
VRRNGGARSAFSNRKAFVCSPWRFEEGSVRRLRELTVTKDCSARPVRSSISKIGYSFRMNRCEGGGPTSPCKQLSGCESAELVNLRVASWTLSS